MNVTAEGECNSRKASDNTPYRRSVMFRADSALATRTNMSASLPAGRWVWTFGGERGMEFRTTVDLSA